VAKLPLDFLIATKLKYRGKLEKGMKKKGYTGNKH